MSKKGRPPPPPKPEELIEILDKKFEAYKVEMAEALENKSVELSKLREEQEERSNKILVRIDELEKSFVTYREEQSLQFEKIEESQTSICTSMRVEFQKNISEALEEQRQAFGRLQ